MTGKQLQPEVCQGDLLGVNDGIIFHGVNARGVMGAGVAKAIRQRYPSVWQDYHAAFCAGRLRLGHVVWTKITASPKLAVASAVTQADYGRTPGRCYVDYDAIAQSAATVATLARRHGLSISYPMLGAGLGGGDWARISSLLEDAFTGIPHRVWTLPPSQRQPRQPR